jgi:hypothetical protein
VSRHGLHGCQNHELKGDKLAKWSIDLAGERYLLGEGARGGVSIASCSGAVIIAAESQTPIGVKKLEKNIDSP